MKAHINAWDLNDLFVNAMYYFIIIFVAILRIWPDEINKQLKWQNITDNITTWWEKQDYNIVMSDNRSSLRFMGRTEIIDKKRDISDRNHWYAG